MDGILKLAQLSAFMDVEIAEEANLSAAGCGFAGDATKTRPAEEGLPVYLAALPNGQRAPILKTVLTSACERNCNYCAFRAGRDFRRHTFTPEEMARTHLALYQKGAVQGLFLSSGIAGGGLRTQDRLLDTAEILRTRLNYRGYLHLKVMPGADRAQVERAMLLADRVSINLEGPSDARLAVLAPQKHLMEELLRPLRWIEEIRRSQPGLQAWNGRWPSSATQFVVGAAGEDDLELLRATAYLHQKLRLQRVYFSGFHPVSGTPLENQASIQPGRQERLYQAAFLLRDYGFAFEELPFTPAGYLPLDVDPKLAWAQANLQQRPLELNQATPDELLRVPGIGRKGAQAILRARRTRGPLRSLDDLRALGIRPNRAAPFILLNGRQPPLQMALF